MPWARLNTTGHTIAWQKAMCTLNQPPVSYESQKEKELKITFQNKSDYC
jgi:hypothetical protein